MPVGAAAPGAAGGRQWGQPPAPISIRYRGSRPEVAEVPRLVLRHRFPDLRIGGDVGCQQADRLVPVAEDGADQRLVQRQVPRRIEGRIPAGPHRDRSGAVAQPARASPIATSICPLRWAYPAGRAGVRESYRASSSQSAGTSGFWVGRAAIHSWHSVNRGSAGNRCRPSSHHCPDSATSPRSKELWNRRNRIRLAVVR